MLARVLSVSTQLSKMNIRDFLKGSSVEIYWALVIEPGLVQSAVWQIQDGKAQVLATSPVSAWETDEELVDASDTSLSAAIQNLPEDIKEPTNTVFGVPSFWVSEGQIKAEYLTKIKKICSELSLTPAGFVVLPEAISNLYKSEEGAPVSAIILGVTKENLEVSVFSMGNLIGTTSVSRSVSVFDDVVEGLTRFSSSDTLPSRILIYDGKEGDLEDMRQEIMAHDWSEVEKIKFLHTPKVELLDPEQKVVSVALAGAAEIGEVSSVETFKNEEEGVAPELTPETELENEENQNIQTVRSSEELGFVVDQDVAEVPGKLAPEETPVEVGQQVPVPTMEKTLLTGQGVTVAKNFFASLVSKFKKIFNKAKMPGVSKMTVAKMPSQNIFLIGSLVVLILVVSFFAYWWFGPKAAITVYVSPQTINERVNITVNPDTSTNTSENILKGEVIDTSVNGEKQVGVTGRKVVGDKAKGSVNIRNGMSTSINLPVGSVLISSGNLRFLTSEAVEVTEALSPNSPGTGSVEVVAAAIGSEYNLAKDESFKVANYPKADVDAVSSSDLSGGSSREINAVSQEDRTDLLKDLTENLLDEATGKLKTSVSGDRIFLEGSAKEVDSDATFDHAVGDEASNIKLKLDLKAQGVVVDKNSLFEMAQKVLKDKVPGGYVLRGEQLTFEFEQVGENDGVYEFETQITANLLPEVKTDDIAKQISGKIPERAQEFLNSIPGFSKAEIKLSPKLPGIFGNIPRVVENIEIQVAAER